MKENTTAEVHDSTDSFDRLLDHAGNVNTLAGEPIDMSLVPAGETTLFDTMINELDACIDPVGRTVQVNSFYIDRFAVTNADYLRFVENGGYTEMELWPQEIWASLLQFVDQTGKPGPRYWKNGKPEKRLLKHPVVGICWFEANAFATWNEKRLPNSSQWQHAATWSTVDSQGQARYPWAGGFQASKANIWISGRQSTVAVDRYYEGCTANGVYQLVGNVWEWVSTRFHIQHSHQSQQQLNSDLIEVRGGAFDTYFESQATCQFRTGQPCLFRGSNVGFRCCKEKV